jgi:hypothetical protein
LLQLDERDPGFQLLTEDEIAATIVFISTAHIITFFHLFVLKLSVASLIRICEGIL